MIIFVFLLIVWAPYIIAKVARYRDARTLNETQPRGLRATPEALENIDPSSRSPLAWSVLDDRQLTRLLTDSAPRPITE